MATITVDNYLDGGVARSAGEAWTIQNNARLTIRTDTRWHSNSPASMTGSLGSQTITEGEILIDGRNVRWMPFDSGSGNVPAIGTIITQGVVSGYLLGVWASVTSSPTAVAAAMPTSGFIKFREVSGGVFSAGTLTGIGASATGPDVTGWIEVVADQGADVTVPRLGRYRVYGNKFFLPDTTGVLGQTITVPCNGGGVNTLGYGVFVETSVGSNTYEFWPAINSTNCWAYQHIGMPPEEADIRQKFVNVTAGTGQMVFGETKTAALTGTYAATASTTGTYVEANNLAQYWVYGTDKIYVQCGGLHQYSVGEQVGIQFTSGGMFTPINRTAICTVVEVPSPSAFVVDFVGASGSAGNCTVRSKLAVTITSNPLKVGFNCFLDFTTGNGVDGTFKVHSYNTTNSYFVLYPRTAALTVGSVTEYSRITLTTSVAHNLQAGHRIKVRFTSGTAVSGIFTVLAVPTTTTITINYPFNGGTGGNFEIDFQLGYVPAAGLKTWIPNVFFRQCATGTRASNALPHITVATRPEFITTASGDIEINYAYSDWQSNFAQSYSCIIKDSVFSDPVLQISECNRTPVIRNIGISSVAATSIANGFSMSSMQQGVDVDNVTAVRNSTATNSSLAYFGLLFGGTIKNIKVISLNFAAPTSSYLSADLCKDSYFENVEITGGYFRNYSSVDLRVKNLDYTYRLCGRNFGYNSPSVVGAEANPNSFLVDGFTFGRNGAVRNQMSNGGLLASNSANNVKIRNAGTLANPLQGRVDEFPELGGVGTLMGTGSRSGIKMQSLYVDFAYAVAFTDANDAKDVVIENVYSSVLSSSKNSSGSYTTMNAKNSIYRNIGILYASSGAASVFGSHFIDVSPFYYDGSATRLRQGEYNLQMNEPSDQTAQYYTVNSGTPKFNAAGGVLMAVVGDSATWEDPYFRKGYIGFEGESYIAEPSMTGGTYSSFLLEYQIDKGSGFGSWLNLLKTYAGGSGTVGAYTVNVTNATGILPGDYIWGTSITSGTKVVSIDGNTLTIDKPNYSTVSGNIRISSLYSETGIDPSIGFRLKIRITTTVAGSAAITRVMVRTKFTQASLEQAVYPMDQIKLTITGLVSGSDVVILEAGTENVLIAAEDVNATFYDYLYETPVNVDISIYKPGYKPHTTIRNYALGLSDSSIPVVQEEDPSYLD